jgi:hypothetical protein
MKNYSEEEKELINGLCEDLISKLFPRTSRGQYIKNGLIEFQEANGLTPKPKLELGYVYKDNKHPEYLMMIDVDGRAYGFDCNGRWFFKESKPSANFAILNEGASKEKAKNEEWITALTKELEKRGYTLDSEIVSFFGGMVGFAESLYEMREVGEFWWKGSLVMKDGVWAEIVKTPEVKEVTMSEVENQFGCKVKIIKD